MAQQQTESDAGRKRVLAAGGIIGALLASSCCVAPLVLLTLGISGAWIGTLTDLAPYQGYFTVATLAFLGMGFWTIYRKPKQACREDSYCANPMSDIIIKTVLWAATGLIGIALTVDWWTPYLI
jgi:mercuric ion transport protein